MYKIGVANKDGILKNLNLTQLRDAGVESIEDYCSPVYTKLKDMIQRYVDEGFEPIIHLGGILQPSAIESFLERTHQFRTLRRVVVHPVDHAEYRDVNHQLTIELCHLLASMDANKFCLENLPFNPNVPQRFGDNLSDVFNIANGTGIKNCFDTGHYLSGQNVDDDFARFTFERSKHIEHFHIHAFVNDEDHHPLQDDRKCNVKQIIKRFQAFRPKFDGTLSIEVLPFGHTEQDAVFGSIDYLKSFIRNS